MALTDWNRRWWLLPGEIAAGFGTTELVFESDGGTLWTFSLHAGSRVQQICWDHQARVFATSWLKDLDPDTITALNSVLRTMTGRPQSWTLQGIEKKIVDTIAQAMLDDEWITGRRLRVLLEMRSADFGPVADGLQPRYLRAREGDNGDSYSLTIPGLWFSSQAPRVQRILDAIIGTLKGKFRADPDVRKFTLDEVVASGGVDDGDRCLIVALVSLTGLMYGGQGARSDRRYEFSWGVPPREIEDIACLNSVNDLFVFFQQRPQPYVATRCWPTAPIRPIPGGVQAPPAGYPPREPDSHPTGIEVGDVNDERLTEELAKVIWEPERARDVAIAAGFGSGSIPVMKIPLVFWSGLVEDARNGAIRGRVQALADAAAREFPDNAIFRRYRGT